MDTGDAREHLRTALVVGTGLMGTSVALALRAHDLTTYLLDADPEAAHRAAELGAGDVGEPPRPVDLAVLAVPPQHLGRVLLDLQKRDLARAYTDVCSVKALPQRDAETLGADTTRFIGGHPLAGRERSGPGAARGDLFEGRPWVLAPSAATSPETVARARALVELCDALPVTMTADQHDHAVALISHAPHLVSALMAARLAEAEETAVGLSGQGIRDVTRIAASDAGLWTRILTANAKAVADVLTALREDLDATIAALRDAPADAGGDPRGEGGPGEPEPGASGHDRLAGVLRRGSAGQARIPGKHGTPPARYAVVPVVVGDRPGELARLFAHVGEAGVNIEDVDIEHSPGQPVGLAQISVRPATADVLVDALRRRGWTVHT